MHDLSQGVDVVEENLPQPEDLDRIRVERCEGSRGLARAQQEEYVVPPNLVPRSFDADLIHLVHRCICFTVAVARKLLRICYQLTLLYACSGCTYPSVQGLPEITRTVSSCLMRRCFDRRHYEKSTYLTSYCIVLSIFSVVDVVDNGDGGPEKTASDWRSSSDA